MKTVAIAGTPRKRGNSLILLESFVEEAAFRGKLSFFQVYSMEIAPCVGCGRCFDGKCPFEDDASSFLETVEDADFLVLSSPVYFYSPPAPLKALIDRSQPLWYRTFVRKKPPKRKKGALILTSATKSRRGFEAFSSIVRAWFNSLNASLELVLTFGGLEAEAQVLEMDHVFERVIHESERFFAG